MGKQTCEQPYTFGCRPLTAASRYSMHTPTTSLNMTAKIACPHWRAPGQSTGMANVLMPCLPLSSHPTHCLTLHLKRTKAGGITLLLCHSALGVGHFAGKWAECLEKGLGWQLGRTWSRNAADNCYHNITDERGRWPSSRRRIRTAGAEGRLLSLGVLQILQSADCRALQGQSEAWGEERVFSAI